MTLLDETTTDETPERFLAARGTILARFDQRTQDSGNVSYGVSSSGRQFFVKTAGSPASASLLNHQERVRWLHNAARLSNVLRHHALPRLLNLVESPHGPMLVYDWVPGELVGVPSTRRMDPSSSFARFKALPLDDLCTALTSVFDVHDRLCSHGWVASDFYDGAMIYDFRTHRLWLVDLDMYRDGPFSNEMGRMFGSTRFMAPEEFELGARIDQATTVFTMGRCIQVFLLERAAGRDAPRLEPVLDVAERACASLPCDRWSSLHEFCTAWYSATNCSLDGGSPTMRCT